MSEVQKGVPQCDAATILHSDHTLLTAGCDTHPDNCPVSLAKLNVKTGRGGLSMRLGLGRRVVAVHVTISEGHRLAGRNHMKTGLSMNFVKSREVELCKSLAKSRLVWGRVESWARQAVGVTWNGKEVQSQPSPRPTLMGKPCSGTIRKIKVIWSPVGQGRFWIET